MSSKVVTLRTMPQTKQPATIEPTAWEQLPEGKRRTANERHRLVKVVLAHEEAGASRSTAIDALLFDIDEGEAIPAIIDLAIQLGRKDKRVGRATLYRWVNAYDESGLMGLVSGHKGSARKVQGWEALAMRLYNRPSKPSMSAVARELREEHKIEEATDDAVRRYLKSLPANLGISSRGRLGERLHRNTQKGFVRRDTEVLPVGAIYQGDGHTIDVYVAHPFTGKIWRPELTVWIDVRSRYIAGWYISESESSYSTLFALSHALIAHDHAPAMLHIDNGSGYASKLMSDDSVGYYARFDIEAMFALPYNAKAKGQVERFFGTMERDFGKRWESYCGADMAAEVLNKLAREVNQGKRELPSLQEYTQALAAWIDNYHQRPHRGLDGKCPAELWATLEPSPLHTPEAAIIRPSIERMVRRSSVQLHNREYTNAELVAYNGSKLMVEYDLHNDELVRMMDRDGRWICDAHLVHKAAYVPASRMEQAQQRRLLGQQKRLKNHLREVEDRAGLTITHDQVLEDIEALNDGAAMLLEEKTESQLADRDPVKPNIEDLNKLDVLDIDY